MLTAEEIKASGARTIPDALRAVPGVDVFSSRSGQEEVGIRGLDKPLNNRVLVLLDGKTELNGMFENITWERIPVSLQEIDRIEVVEGPASALYGANAVSGVINIITKTPEQLKGGLVSHAGGEANAHSGAALYGNRSGKADYKLGLSERYVHRFSDESLLASRTQAVHALGGYDFSDEQRVALSGGLSKFRTQSSAGSVGSFIEDGIAGFARADYRLRDTKVRAFWNRGRTDLKDFAALDDPQLDYDTVDADVQHSLALPYENALVIGGGYRRNTAFSKLLPAGTLSQDLWSIYFEDEWRPADRWTLVGSGRLDRHPLTPLAFSPHGSVIYDVAAGQILRLSAGTAFRNPTLLENYLQVNENLPNSNPGFTTTRVATSGDRILAPERMFQLELSHVAQFGAVKTTAALWYYRLRNTIAGTNPVLVSAAPPILNLRSTFGNGGGTRGEGFELGADARVRSWLNASANYSYQDLKDDDPSTQTSAQSSPRHKVNAGLRARKFGWTASLSGDWVDATRWNQSQPGTAARYAKVPDYCLLNGRVAYAFTGAWSGLEASLSAFNLTGRAHYETLPSAGPSLPGQNGELVRARWMGALEYRF